MTTGHTRMGCLLGSPVSHSKSPQMYNESFLQLGIDCHYLCFDIGADQLEVTIQALRAMNVFGFNLTMPDKTAVIPYLDELSVEAELIGAVNTVNNENGRLVGYNTDGMGYVRSVREAGLEIAGKEITLMGAGGAACAIAVQLALDGAAALHLACRKGKSWERARQLSQMISSRTDCRADLTDMADLENVEQLLECSVLLTNATSAGMAPDMDRMPLPESIHFPKQLTVSDIIYNPRQTKLLRTAAAQGCRTIEGLQMLLWQGEAAFRIWTGQQMPVDLIRRKYFDR